MNAASLLLTGLIMLTQLGPRNIPSQAGRSHQSIKQHILMSLCLCYVSHFYKACSPQSCAARLVAGLCLAQCCMELNQADVLAPLAFFTSSAPLRLRREAHSWAVFHTL